MQSLPRQKADELIRTYMAIYVTGINASSTSEALMKRYVGNISKIYPGWEHTVKFLQHLQNEVVGDRPVYEFSDITDVVEEAGERFGRFQNHECLDLKKTLVGLEESSGSGRVRLSDFYGSALNGQRQFSESVEYLRQLGALDESDSSNFRIIIPNYLNAPSNCIASSAYYGVCCIDECEEILGHVEKQVRGPTAHPTEIADIIVNLPSASMAVGRKLSVTLMQRLTELGEHHGNRIPIHGRLFAQWMHLAYPRECPFPHISGTIQPKTAKEMRAVGQATKAQKEVMQQFVKAGREKSNKEEEGCDNEICSEMWSMEEELVDGHAHSSEIARREGRGPWRTVLFFIFTCTAAISLALSLLRALGTTLETVEVNTKTRFPMWARASLKQTLNIH